jgi:DNA (cytosine-5)-methyltransferase 1
MTLTVGSLFSGIGGLDLGLERAGMNVIWQSEIDPYACRVLKKHWPEVPNHGDIKQIDWSRVERPAVICGGYPCQPFSTAGNRKGEEDPRHLWPWVRQAISELRPRYAILENVRGHLSLGGTTVIADLAAIGYDAEWRIVSAASVGAAHRRDRIIIVAYPNDAGPHSAQVNPAETGQYAQRGLGGCGQDVAYPNGTPGQQQCKREIQEPNIGRRGTNVANTQSSVKRNSESHGVCTVYGQATELGKQGWDSRSISSWWETEPDVGRVADGVPARVDRLRGLGNAVVPQVAEVIGRLVVEHATYN